MSACSISPAVFLSNFRAHFTDLLYAPTFPAATEALGVARAMADTGLPCVISPIITNRGTLLDGTPLAEVIARIDDTVTPRPACYTVSCVHPSVLRDALEAAERLRSLAGDRLLGSRPTRPAARPPNGWPWARWTPRSRTSSPPR